MGFAEHRSCHSKVLKISRTTGTISGEVRSKWNSTSVSGQRRGLNPTHEGGELSEGYLEPIHIACVNVRDTSKMAAADLALSHNPCTQFFLPKRV